MCVEVYSSILDMIKRDASCIPTLGNSKANENEGARWQWLNLGFLRLNFTGTCNRPFPDKCHNNNSPILYTLA